MIDTEIEGRILNELGNNKWDYRTMDGLRRSTGLPESEIEKIINHNPNKIYISPSPDKEGRTLYALQENVNIFSRIYNQILSALS